MIQELTPTSSGRASRKPRNFLLCAVALLLIVVCVGVIYYFAVSQAEQTAVESQQNINTKQKNAVNLSEASRYYASIRDKKDDELNYDDVITEFELRIYAAEDYYDKLDYSLYYAAFVYDREDDAQKALSILQRIDAPEEKESAILNYYVQARDYYKALGNQEGVDLCNERLAILSMLNYVTPMPEKKQ